MIVASRRSSLLALAMVAAITGPALTGCAAGMSRLKSGIAGKPGMMSMPNLFRMSKAKAVSTLKLAGHQGDVSWDDQLCGSVVEGQIVEKDEICRQTPMAGQEIDARAPVRLLAQPEDPRHGKVGQVGEWHLMPAVVGMPLEQAQAAMRAAGFTDERTHVDESSDSGCKPRVVCKTYPVALERAGQGGDRYLTVGAGADVRPPGPARPEPEGSPADQPAAPPAPPPKPPEGYF